MTSDAGHNIFVFYVLIAERWQSIQNDLFNVVRADERQKEVRKHERG